IVLALGRPSLELLSRRHFTERRAGLPHRWRDLATHFEGVGKRSVCPRVSRERVHPSSGDVYKELAVPCQRLALRLRPLAAVGHGGARDRVEGHGVGLELWKSEVGNGVEASLAPPEVLRQQEVGQPLSRVGSEGEVERRGKEQRLC